MTTAKKKRACPSKAQLEAFCQGAMPDKHLAIIRQHLSGCPRCAEVVTELSKAGETIVTPAAKEPTDTEQRRAADASPAGSGTGRKAPPPAATEPTIDLPAAASQPDLGSLGVYQLLTKLGEGGMGAVYKALHTRLKRLVAIKVLPADRMRNAESVSRFQREMEAVGTLDHPNIVRATDAGEVNGTHFLVMELVEGIDLATLLQRVGPLRVADACELVRQAAVGLQHAHEQGMVHRDIKPSNLMLTPSGVVKILDMGLALLGGPGNESGRELTSSGQLMGTIDYMAPEQGIDTHNVDIRADVYALGATLYKLLAGVAPFAGPRYDTTMKKLLALASEEPPPIESCRSDISDELAAIVQRCLAKKPGERFSNPAELAEALSPIAAAADLTTLISSVGIEPGPSDPRSRPGESATRLPTSATRPGLSESGRRQPVGGDRQAASSATAAIKRRFGLKSLLAAGIALAIVAAAAAYVMHVKSDEGEVLIGCDEEQVEIAIHRNGDVAQSMTLTAKESTATVGVGEVQVVVTGARADEFQVTHDTTTLRRGGRVVVKIQRITSRNAAKEKEKNPGGAATSAAGTFTPAAGPLDLLRLIDPQQDVIAGKWRRDDDGSWHAESGDKGEPLLAFPLVVQGDYRLRVELTRISGAYGAGCIIPVGSRHAEVFYGSNNNNRSGLGSIDGQPFNENETTRRRGMGFELGKRHVMTVEVRQAEANVRVQAGLDGASFVNWFGAVARLSLPASHALTQPGLPGLTAASDYHVHFHQVTLELISGEAKLLRPADAAKLKVASQPAPISSGPGLYDQLQRKDIDPYELKIAGDGDAAKAAPELVAIFGDSRLRHGSSDHTYHVGGSLFFAPRGDRLASVADDNVLRVWDARSGDQLGALDVLSRWPRVGKNYHYVCYLFFSQDGQELYFLADDVLRAWSFATSTLRNLPIRHPGAIVLQLSADLTTAVTQGPDGQIQVWELPSGKPHLKVQAEPFKKPSHARSHYAIVALSPDGKRLAFVQGKAIKIWSVAENKEEQELPPFPFKGYLTFSNDGTLLAIPGEASGTTVWDLAAKRQVLSTEAFKALGAGDITAAFSYDNRYLATRGKIIDLSSGKVHVPLRTHESNKPTFMVFSPDKQRIAAMITESRIQVFDMAGDELLADQGHERTIMQVAVTPDRIVTYDFGGRFSFWSPQQRAAHSIRPNLTWTAAAVSPSGDKVLILTSTGGLTEHDAATGAKLSTLGLPPSGFAEHHLLSVDAKGRYLASWSHKGIAIWDLQTRALKQLPTGTKYLNVALLPGGKLLVMDEKQVTQWNLAADKFDQPDRTFPNRMRVGVQVKVSRDGTLMAGSYGSTVVVDVSTGQKLHEQPSETLCAFSPDGTTLATIGGTTVTIRNARTGAREKTIELGLGQAPIDLEYTPDGRHLVVAHGNGTAFVLRLSTIGSTATTVPVKTPPRADPSGTRRKVSGMFTGIVETLGTVACIVDEPPGQRLVLRTARFAADAKIGESVAINGCCLTVVAAEDDCLSFQAGPETLRRTNLGQLRVGDAVNLERSLQLGDRLGGHFVTGHIDGLGVLTQREDQGEWSTCWFAMPSELAQHMASKGSVAIDGVSLTLVDVAADRFSVALIPHTLAATTLGRLRIGDRVNLETDVLAKYVARQCADIKPEFAPPHSG